MKTIITLLIVLSIISCSRENPDKEIKLKNAKDYTLTENYKSGTNDTIKHKNNLPIFKRKRWLKQLPINMKPSIKHILEVFLQTELMKHYRAALCSLKYGIIYFL